MLRSGYHLAIWYLGLSLGHCQCLCSIVVADSKAGLKKWCRDIAGTFICPTRSGCFIGPLPCLYQKKKKKTGQLRVTWDFKFTGCGGEQIALFWFSLFRDFGWSFLKFHPECENLGVHKMSLWMRKDIYKYFQMPIYFLWQWWPMTLHILKCFILCI